MAVSARWTYSVLLGAMDEHLVRESLTARVETGKPSGASSATGILNW